MGTTMQSIAGRGSLAEGAAGQPIFQERVGQWQRPQRSIESPDASFSTPVQTGQLFAEAAAQNGPFGGSAVSQQRNATQIPQGSTGNQQTPRNAHTPTPTSGPAAVNGNVVNGAAANGAAAMNTSRGPVEFNHAISYVNKIKVSFFAYIHPT